MCHLCPHVNKCCCGCSLRTGAIIIGCVGLIGSLIIIAFSFGAHILKRTDMLSECAKSCAKKTDFSKCLEDCLALSKANRTMYTYGVVLYIADVIIYVILLVGVLANIPVLLVLHVYSLTVFYVLTFLFDMGVLIYNGVATWFIVGRLFCYVIITSLIVYFCIVIYSLYRTMVSPDYGYPTGGAYHVSSEGIPGAYPVPPGQRPQYGPSPNYPGMPPLYPQPGRQ